MVHIFLTILIMHYIFLISFGTTKIFRLNLLFKFFILLVGGLVLRCQEGIVRQRKGLKRMVFGPLSPMHVRECDTVEADVSLGHLAW